MAGAIVIVAVILLAVFAARKSFFRKGGLMKGCVGCAGSCDCGCCGGGKQE